MSQQLQFNPDGPQIQPLQVSEGFSPLQLNPPYLPAPLQQHMDLVSSVAVMAIQEKMTHSPARMYTYNAMSQNNWNNRLFTQYVDLLVRSIEMHMTNNRNDDLRAVTWQLSRAIAEYFAALMVFDNQALQAMLPDQEQPIKDAVGEFQRLRKTLETFYNQSRQAVQRQQHTQQAPANSNWGGGVNQTGQSAGLVSAAGSLTTAPAPAPAANGRVLQVKTAPAPVAAPAAAYPQPVPEIASTRVQAARPTQHSEYKLEDKNYAAYDTVAFKATDKYLFAPAFNPHRELLLYKLPMTKDEPMTPAFMAYKPADGQPSKPPMQIGDHIQGLNTNPFPIVGLNVEKENQRNAPADGFQTLNPELVVNLLEDTNLEVMSGAWSDEELFFNVQLQLAVLPAFENKIPVVTRFGALHEPIVLRSDLRHFLGYLRTHGRTHVALAKALRAESDRLQKASITGEAPNGLAADPTTLAALTALNKRLTQMTGAFCYFGLGMRIRPSNYMLEIEELETKIGMRSPRLKLIWDAHQAALIAMALDTVEDGAVEQLVELEESSLHPERKEMLGNTVFTTIMRENNSYTAVGLLSTQLQAQFPHLNVSVSVTAERQPILHALAKHIFDHEEELQSQFPDTKVSRHLLRTLDGVTFAVNRSPIVSTQYLIHMGNGRHPSP